MCDHDSGSFHANDNCRDLIKPFSFFQHRWPPISNPIHPNIISDSLIWTMLSFKTYFDFD